MLVPILVSYIEHVCSLPNSRTKKISLWVGRLMIRFITKVYDPFVEIRFGSVVIEAHLSHEAVLWRGRYPNLNRNFARLARYVLAARPGSSIIDVGANIGDGAAIIREADIDAPIFAVEGNEKFVRTLQRNKPKLGEITIYPNFVGDHGAGRFEVVSFSSSGHLRASKSGTISGEALATLDEIIPSSADVGLLKVDTDGFDFPILRGAMKIIATYKPVLFVEWDTYIILRVGENIADFLRLYRTIGYRDIILWDNHGSLICSASLEDEKLITQLSFYFFGDETRPFIDMAIFPESSADLFKTSLESETNYFKEILQREGVLAPMALT